MISLAYAALWLFVFSIPWETIVAVTGMSVLTKATGTLALGLALLAVVVTGRVRRWHIFHVAALLFVIWAAACLFLFHSGERLPSKFWTFVQLLLVVWMMWERAPSKRNQLGLLLAYVLGAYVAALGTIVMFRREAGLMRRFTAAGTDPNDLAMTLALALPMAWYLGTTYRQPMLRWACRGYLPVGLIAIGLTGSRGGMLAAIVGLMMVPLSMTKLSPSRIVTAIVMLGVSGALAVAYLPKASVQRLASTTTEVEDGSLGGRFKIWRAGVKAFVQKPLVGYGTTSFKRAITPWIAGNYVQVAHNSYLSVLVEQGLIGFLFFSTMFLMVFLALLDLPPPDRRFALVMLATLGVAMLPLSWEDTKPVWFILAALIGLSCARVGGWGAARSAPTPRSAPMAQPPVGGRRVQPLGAQGRNPNWGARA